MLKSFCFSIIKQERRCYYEFYIKKKEDGKDFFEKFAEELKPGTPLSLVKCIKYSKVPNPPGKKCKDQVIEFPIIESVLFTDGNIVNITDEFVENVNSFNIDGHEYKNLDLQKTKYVYLFDYTYAVIYLLAKEWLVKDKCSGMFDVVKKVSIYLKDKQDKDAIKRVKEVLKTNSSNSKKIDTSSVFALTMFSAISQQTSYSPVADKEIYLIKRK